MKTPWERTQKVLAGTRAASFEHMRGKRKMNDVFECVLRCDGSERMLLQRSRNALMSLFMERARLYNKSAARQFCIRRVYI